MIKLYRARSLLYRRQILQQNMRWKALDEIYKIYMLLHRSDLKISEKNRQAFSHFLANFAKIRFFEFFLLSFAQILMKCCRNFADISCHSFQTDPQADILENVENFPTFSTK